MAKSVESYAEQYQHSRYQRTQGIESRWEYLLSLEDRYMHEAVFALESANLSLAERDRVLDLACGIGEHARIIRDITGVDVDAFDLSNGLLEKARIREQMREGIRGKLSFALGDMGNIVLFIPSKRTYKLITILGFSFFYLQTPDAYRKALADYHSLLEPGGKIVIQFRTVRDVSSMPDEVNNQQKEVMRTQLGVEAYTAEAEGPEGKFGRFVKAGQRLLVQKDTVEGDGTYYYFVEPIVPKGARVKRGENNLSYYDEDGIAYYAFRRVYIDKDGNEEDLGFAQINDYHKIENYPILKRKLESAGFVNVRLNRRQLSPESRVELFAVVAEKVA